MPLEPGTYATGGGTTRLDQASPIALQMQREQEARDAQRIAELQAQNPGQYNSSGQLLNPAGVGTAAWGQGAVQAAAPAPKPAPAPSAGIISGATGGAVFGAGPSPGQAPSPAPAAGGGAVFGAGPSPSPAPSASGGAVFGAGGNQPKNPIKTVLDSQTWQGQGKDAAPTKALYDAAVANNWSPEQVAEQLQGVNGDWVRELYRQYGYQWPPAGGATGGGGSVGGGANAGGGTGGAGGGGIIASQTKSAQLGNPTDWNVTPEQTVEGRINSIIDPKNPIMAQARARSLDQMNARGLANSSLAITAGESAAYDAAIPIAQADAATFAKAAGYNADQKNQFARENITSENQFRLQGMNNDAQRDLALINRDTQIQLSKMNSEQQQLAAKLEMDNRKLLDTNGKAAEAFNTAMSAINNVNMNNQMDADTKTRTVASIWRDTQIQLNTLGRVAGLNLTQDLDFAGMPGFNDKGMYVGFEDGPGAVTRTSAPAGIIAGAQGGESGGFPQYINGVDAGWNTKSPVTGTTAKQDYDKYASSGGKMTPREWWLTYAANSEFSGGPGNASSSPSTGTGGGVSF